MKRLIATAMIAATVLCGCSRGIDGEYIAKAAGFSSSDRYGFELTLAPAVGEGISVEAPTLDGARREVMELSGKKLYTGQTELILLQRRLAEEDTAGITDALFEQSERQNMERIVICEGETAELLKETPKEIINALENLKKTSYIAPATVRSVYMASRAVDGCALIPYIGRDRIINRYALIQDGRMTELLDEDESRGAGFMNGQSRDFFTIDVGGDLRDAEISDADCEVRFSDDGEYRFEIIVSLKCSEDMQEAAEKYICECVEKAAAAAKRSGADFLGLAARVLNSDNVLRDKYSGKWNEVIKSAVYTVETGESV